MTTQQKIKDIQKACIKANPEINNRDCSVCGKFPLVFPIRLADVLLAIRSSNKVVDLLMTYDKKLLITKDGDGSYWNLKDDDLKHQSEETLDFLYKIICE